MNGAAACRTAATTLLFLTFGATAFASQGPGVTEGNAEPITQATAAALALLPLVAVSVFALARAIGGRPS